MDKTELIAEIAKRLNLTKKDTGLVIDTALQTIQERLVNGDSVGLLEFGTFSTSKRAAREAINPSTGTIMNIPATTVARFKAGKSLKEAVAK